MMVRTQISLEDADLKAAKERAAQLGVSLAEYIRRVIRDDLGARPRSGHISQIFGILPGGAGSDASQRVDEIVSDAILEDHLRSIGELPDDQALDSRPAHRREE